MGNYDCSATACNERASMSTSVGELEEVHTEVEKWTRHARHDSWLSPYRATRSLLSLFQSSGHSPVSVA